MAANPNTPRDSLVELALSVDQTIRSRVAQNPNTPEDVLVKLVDDECWEVSKAVLTSSNTPEILCTLLYQDAVQKETLDENFAICIVKRNVLPKTELLALISLYGESVAKEVAASVNVKKGLFWKKFYTSITKKPNKRKKTPPLVDNANACADTNT